MRALPIVTFSTPISVGSLPGSDWQTRTSAHLLELLAHLIVRMLQPITMHGTVAVMAFAHVL